MKNMICYLFGHKEGDLNDSGYPVCERCNSHSYYDNWNKSGYLIKPFTYIRWRWYLFVSRYNNKLPF